MNKYLTIFIVIALIAGGISYLAIENIYITIGVVILYIVIPILLYIPLLIKHEKVIDRFHECYHFINNFIISLSIKKTMGLSLENVVLSMNPSFQELYGNLENMNDHEKLSYLGGSYFPFYLYQLFLQIVSIYEEQGGDILEMSKYLLTELRHSEEYVTKVSGLGKRKYVEIGVLWLICGAILAFMRFALKDFYSKLKNQLVFIIAIAVFLLFVLLSIYMLIKRGTNIELKGYKKDEKII